MSVYAVFQAVVITVVVAYCFVRLMQKLSPTLVHAVQAMIARGLNRDGLPGFVRAVGRKLQPVETPEGGCGGCRGCELSQLRKS